MEEKKSTVKEDQINEYETRLNKMKATLRELTAEGKLLESKVKNLSREAGCHQEDGRYRYQGGHDDRDQEGRREEDQIQHHRSHEC